MHVQPRVLFLVLLDRQLAPHPPVLERLLVAVLHALEPCGRLLADLRVLLRVGVHLDVDLEEVLDRILLKSLLRTVLFEADCDETELYHMLAEKVLS